MSWYIVSVGDGKKRMMLANQVSGHEDKIQAPSLARVAVSRKAPGRI